MKYQHGGDIYGEHPVDLDFSVNVNPLGAPENVLAAAADSIRECFHYPDSRCGRFRRAVSSWYQIPEDEIIFGNGAADLIFSVVRAVKPEKAVLLAPSFLEYANALNSAGATIEFFYLKEENGFSIPVGQYLEFLERKRPQMIFLCNPSNPAGVLTGRQDLSRILEFCRLKQIFAVVDECFLEFLENPGRFSALDEVKDGMENLMVIQAPTKTFALAGLRAGYGFLNNRSLMEQMTCMVQPWGVSIPAQAAGTAVFWDGREEYLRRTRAFIKEEKAFLENGLKEGGFTVYGGEANFLFFKDLPERKPGRLYTELLERGILIRCCGNYEGLDGRFYRICVGNRRENQKLLETISSNL